MMKERTRLTTLFTTTNNNNNSGAADSSNTDSWRLGIVNSLLYSHPHSLLYRRLYSWTAAKRTASSTVPLSPGTASSTIHSRTYISTVKRSTHTKLYSPGTVLCSVYKITLCLINNVRYKTIGNVAMLKILSDTADVL